jgi:8-oxo-dGTP diphosphatase
MMDHHVVAVILLRPEEMLLCHRTPARRWYPDVWDFPGGHVEPGENPLYALRREVAEELGRSLGALTAALSCAASIRSAAWISPCGSRAAGGGEVSNMQPHEHDAIGWFTAAQVAELELADPSYLTVLQRLLSA